MSHPNAGHANESYRFVQLSDLHLSSIDRPNPLQLCNKRILGYLSWLKRRRFTHQAWILDKAITAIHDLAVDYHLVTGDLTHIGLKQEFAQCRNWLDKLAACADTLVIPGNHDLYVDSTWQDSFAAWQDLMLDDEGLVTQLKQNTAAGKLDQMYPQVRVRQQLAFIALSSVFPAPWFRATGRINQQQLMRLKFVLADPALAHYCKVLLVHHPITMTHTSKRKSLLNHADLCALLRRTPVDLIVHGHGHTRTLETLACEDGSSTPVVGMASSSSTSANELQRAEFKLFDIKRGQHNWHISMQSYLFDSSAEQFKPAEVRVLSACV